MVGTIPVATRSVGDNHSGNIGHSSGDNINESISFAFGKSRSKSESLSRNISSSREPIIFPHEFATLKDIVVMTPEGFCRVEKLPYYQPLMIK